MDEKRRNIIFYCFVALTMAGLYYLLRNATDNMVQAILLPYAGLSESFFNIHLEYISGTGWLSQDGSFAIGRQCMGEKFTLALFGMTACMFVKHFKGTGKIKWFFISLILALPAGIIANSIRILGSIPFTANEKFPLIHLVLGASTYLLIMITGYTGLNNLFGRRIYE